jgi:SAM-dependent methyltransferase
MSISSADHDAAVERAERERLWHDHRFRENVGRGITIGSLTGDMTLAALARAFNAAKPLCVGKDLLDYGCSFGEASLLFKSWGASTVEGIDISPVAVTGATNAAEAAGVTGVRFQVMNAEILDFPDASFDLVFGVAILHHLDLDTACAEIARVLRPSGTAVFLEPMGHNPFINLVRRATPADRTEDEHPLLVRDFEVLRSHFGTVGTEHINLLTLLTAPLVGLPGREHLRRWLDGADRALLRALPSIGRFSWNVLLRMSDPKVRAAAGR